MSDQLSIRVKDSWAWNSAQVQGEEFTKNVPVLRSQDLITAEIWDSPVLEVLDGDGNVVNTKPYAESFNAAESPVEAPNGGTAGLVADANTQPTAESTQTETNEPATESATGTRKSRKAS